MTNPTLGLAVPAALVAGAFALVAEVHPAASNDPGERVELELAGILEMKDDSASLLVLREKGGRTLLPLVVPETAPQEARRVGLLGDAIEALGGRVAEVQIDRPVDMPSGARVKVAQGARRIEIRGRPSESIALALATGVPIVTTRRVLDEAGLTPEDLARAHAKANSDDIRM